MSRASATTGSRTLAAVEVKQDRLSIAPWVAVSVLLAVTSFIAFAIIFDDAAAAQSLQQVITTNPAFSLVFGKAEDLSTADGFNVWRSLQLTSTFAGLMAIFIVTRNSRGNEDSGQAELIASGVVGRHARLIAAMMVAALASFRLSLVTLAAMLISGGDLTTSVVMALCFMSAGIMFGALGAFTSQLGAFAQTANAFAVTTLGVFYLLRGVADATPDAEWALWWTPLGWIQKVAPGTENNLWPLLWVLALAAVLLGAAIALESRRDFAQGVLSPKPGPARAGAVASVWGLAWRLHRGAIIGWLVALAILGAVFGAVGSSILEVFLQEPDLGTLLGASAGGTPAQMVLGFLTSFLGILAILAGAAGVQVMLRAFTEETQYRTEPLLAGALTRPRLYASHVVIAFAGTTVALALSGALLGIAVSAGDAPVQASDVIKQTIVTLPALWIVVAIAVAVIGARPRVKIAAYVGVILTFALTIIGPTLNLWDWVLAISPLYHVPNVLAENPNYWPVLWLTLIGAVFTAVGFAGYRRRDVAFQAS
jgi:ABC-2 type transport system permease protein